MTDSVGRAVAGVALVEVAPDPLVLGGAERSAGVAADVVEDPRALRVGAAGVEMSGEPRLAERGAGAFRERGRAVGREPEPVRDVGRAAPLDVDHPQHGAPPLRERLEGLRDNLVLGHHRAEAVAGDLRLPPQPVVEVVVVGGFLVAARGGVDREILDGGAQVLSEGVLGPAAAADRRPDPGEGQIRAKASAVRSSGSREGLTRAA